MVIKSDDPIMIGKLHIYIYIYIYKKWKENNDMTTNIAQQKCNNNKCYTSTVRYYTYIYVCVCVCVCVCV